MPARFGPQDILAVFPTGDLSSTPRTLEGASALGLDAYEYAWTTPDSILMDPRVPPAEAGARLADGIESYMHVRGHEGRDTVVLQSLPKRHPKVSKPPSGMRLSLRESFRWNLCAEDDLAQTVYLFQGWLRMARKLGAARLSLHIGSASGQDRSRAMDTALANLEYLCRLRRKMRARKVTICVETSTRPDDIGTPEEVARLCQVDENVCPCLQAARLGILTDGSLLRAETYGEVLDYWAGTAGKERTRFLHVEFSPLVSKYAALDGPDSGDARPWQQFFAPLALSVVERKLEPWIIFSDRDPDWPSALEETRDMQAEAAARMRDICMSEKDSLY